MTLENKNEFSYYSGMSHSLFTERTPSPNFFLSMKNIRYKVALSHTEGVIGGERSER